MYLLLVLIVIIVLLYTTGRESARDCPPNKRCSTYLLSKRLPVSTSTETMHGRRTLLPDIFPDHDPDLQQDLSLDQFMQDELLAEDFINTRECTGAVKTGGKKGSYLPERWDNTVCETHCPDYSMIGTRADSAGNLTIKARDTLYSHVGWTEMIQSPIDQNDVEYVGAQNYAYKERTA